RRRGMKRQNFLDCFADTLVQAEGNAGLGLLLTTLEFQSQLQEEKLFKDQPHVSGSAGRLQVVKAFSRLRPVNLPQSLTRGDQATAVANCCWYRVLRSRRIRRKCVECGPDDPAKPA